MRKDLPSFLRFFTEFFNGVAAADKALADTYGEGNFDRMDKINAWMEEI